MASSGVPRIGARLRAERCRRDVSIRSLAREIGVSASFISQIETEKNSPSVSTLYAITTALGIPIEDLFGVRSPHSANEPVRGETGPVRKPDDRLGPHRRLGPVVRPDGRDVLTLDSGVTWELLGRVPGKHVDFLLITYQPGGTSSSSGLLMRHSGTEFGFVVSGELTLTLGSETHRLRAGDAVSFESSKPHSYRNESTEPAVGVWLVLERSA